MCLFDGFSDMEEQQRKDWLKAVEILLAHETVPADSKAEPLASRRGLLLPRFLLRSTSNSPPSGYVMDWHEDSLQKRLSDERHLWQRRSLLWRLQLCGELAEAMHALHQRNLLHCDIKPENVLLRRASDQIRAFQSVTGVGLMDWGSCVKCAPEEHLHRANPPNFCDQTPSHDIGPAFLNVRGQYINWKWDVFALVLTCWQILLGMPWDEKFDRTVYDDRAVQRLLENLEGICLGLKYEGGKDAFLQPLYSCIEGKKSNWMVRTERGRSGLPMRDEMATSPVKSPSIYATIKKSKCCI